jgi:hypothetical protein
MNTIIAQMLARGTADVQNAAALKTILGAGAPANSTTISAAVEAAGLFVRTTLTLADFPVTVANTTGASFGGAKIYDFPEGRIVLLGALADLTFNWAGTGIGATGSGDFSVGSTTTADATLSSTDANMIASSAMTDPFVAGVGRGVGSSSAALYLDGTATAADAILNLIIDDADVADANSSVVLVSGTVVLLWHNLGDYTAV